MRQLLLLFLAVPLLGISQTQIGQNILGEPEDIAGASLSLSADASIVAIGAPSSNSGPGTTRIFRNENGTWTQIGDDIIGEAVTDRSGNQVSLSADGSIVAISSPFNDGNGNNSGHVRVYQNVDEVWTQIGQDIDGENANDLSGGAISLSSNGDILAIGAISNDGNGSSAGHVRIYQFDENAWVQIGADIDGEAFATEFGSSVSLSSDGSIVAVGAPRDDVFGDNAGRVRVFENQGGNWTQIGGNINGETAAEEFGEVVSLSGDGTILAVGSPNTSVNGDESGRVRVYENQNNTWVQIGQDINGAAANVRLGVSLDISNSGDLIAIGIPFNPANASAGTTLFFENNNGTWTEVGLPINGEFAGDFSGFAVSLSDENNTIAIGEFFNEENGNNAGRVRVFDYLSILSTNSFNTSDFLVLVDNQEKVIRVDLSNSGATLEQMNLYSTSGAYLFSSKEATMSTIGLSTGVYILQTQTSLGINSRKILLVN